MAIELGGGTPMLMEEGTDDNEDDILLAPNTCVMYCDQSDNSLNLSMNCKDWVKHVQDLLRENARRCILDAEIGYAVLFCSTEVHCNPRVHNELTTGTQAATLPSQSLSQAPNFSTSSEVPDSVNRVDETIMNISRRATRGSRKSEVSVVDTSLVVDTERRQSLYNEQGANTSLVNQKNTNIRFATEDVTVKKEPLSPFKTPEQVQKTAKQGLGQKHKIDTVAPKVEIDMDSENMADMFDSMPTRRSRRKQNSSAEATVSSKNTTRKAEDHLNNENRNNENINELKNSNRLGLSKSKRSVSPRAVSPVFDNDVGDDELFHQTLLTENQDKLISKNVPCKSEVTARSPKAKAQNKPIKIEGDIEDAFDSMPVRSTRKTKEIPPSELDDKKSIPNRSKRPISPAMLKEEEPMRKKAHLQNNQSENDIARDEDNVQSKNGLGTTEGNQFITSKSQKKSHEENSYQPDNTLPRNLVNIEEDDLVIAKTPKPKSTIQSTLTNGTCMWNGRVVKNFKRFRKNASAASVGIPLIIGGTDLEVYRGNSNQIMDDWMESSSAAASQKNELDQLANRMFDELPSRTGQKRTSRK